MIDQRATSTPQYKAYTLANFREIPQLATLSEEQKFAIEVVGNVLPFRTNRYVVEELIDWEAAPHDPMFTLTFPRREMLQPQHFAEMAHLLAGEASSQEIHSAADRIREQLNPHPAGQMEHNVPTLHGEQLPGMQHKYRETMLFFPSQGQTCHAYCTFCFRWPQFVGNRELKFATRQAEMLVEYLRAHPEISDVLFTGGDPMIMNATSLATYIEPLLVADLPTLKTIRIGTKSLSYWPYRYLTDPDADEVLALFERVARSGRHLAIMAHFNHPRELQTEAVEQAAARIRATGAQIRTQSPVLRHINDSSSLWADMWRRQVQLGMIPYYMFVVRDTGAQHYFGLPLVRAWEIFRKAYSQVSGLSRTVRGPSMSAHPGKVQVLGVGSVHGQKVFCLRFIQGRNAEWVQRPFFAQYDPEAIWLDDLKPAFGEERFFFEGKAKPVHHRSGRHATGAPALRVGPKQVVA